ncbi:MarR family transcriptional regulator [Mesobaculum littorinae]|uniref:MarR family transcriptional regulator n=1 Tax=Mesobaculum littorinae TaxID=2486419 RepID=A0A438AKP5_9RHOB|nr:MarR family transcriptional regulator [Mesobaculum littorinae]RVV99252.1 MarR family transcriptional regulator [Mesobaculum littorinae]
MASDLDSNASSEMDSRAYLAVSVARPPRHADQTGVLIRRLWQRTRETFARQCRDFGVTPEQFNLMLLVRDTPGILQAGLAERAALDQATTGQIIARLTGRGLLARTRNPRDTRSWQVTLTPDGQELIEELLPLSLQASEDFLSPLSAEERDALFSLSHKILEGSAPAR